VEAEQHNLKVLLTDIFPRIKALLPMATLTVVGTGASDKLRTLASKIPGVTMTGRVPDVRPYLRTAALVINYVESGGGIALKVLEAMAMKKPVLSNLLGCEGIRTRHCENVFLVDGPESFAEAAVFLLRNQAMRDKIAGEGYKLIVESYAWNRLVSQFEDVYGAVLAEQRCRQHTKGYVQQLEVG